jgi:branched-subunit amino acid ABC-type transport system permease component
VWDLRRGELTVNTFFTYLTLGVADGSVYALAGLGLVLTFKTSGIFNFAHGAQAASAAYLMYTLRNHDMPWPFAATLAILIAGIVGGLLLERIANLLSGESTAVRVVAMVGILVGLSALLTAIYGDSTLPFKQFLPTDTVRIGSVNVAAHQIIATALAAVAALGLWTLFKFARIGTAMQAVVDDPALLGVLGVSPVAVRRFAWVLGSCFASISGIMLATFVGLDPTGLTLLVVFSFGAAAVGGFSSLPLTYLGGLIIGIGQALSTGYLSKYETFVQLPANVPFIVLVIALLVAPKRLLVERGARAIRAETPLRPFSPRVNVLGGAAAFAALCAVPWVVGYRLSIWNVALAFVVIFASLGLLVRTSGQVSLCHMTFAAVGSAAFAIVNNAGTPWFAGLLVAGLAAVPIGAMVALPAIRLRGVFLAIITLGFGILVERVFFPRCFLFGEADNRRVQRPGAIGPIDFENDKGFYYVLLLIALAVCAFVVAVRRGRLGRMLQVLSSSPGLLSANGASANLAKLYVFCLSAFLAGIGGAMMGAATTATSGIQFNFTVSLTMVAVLFIAGRRPILSAFVAAGLYKIAVPYISDPTVQKLAGVVFGLAALIVTTRAISLLLDRLGAGRRVSERRQVEGPHRYDPPPVAPAVGSREVVRDAELAGAGSR